MEQYILNNVARYEKLVAEFRPTTSGPKESDKTETNPEIVVSARVRPMLDDELAQGFPVGVYIRDGTSIVDLHEIQQPVRGPARIRSFDYSVDRMYGPDATTGHLYKDLVHPLVPWAWGGGIGTMFAYGQTASGKTLTVSGLQRHVAETLMDGSLDGERKISMSIIELAGQTAYDLLNDRKQISILEDSFGVTQMVGALEHHVTDKDTLLRYIDAAAALRSTTPTLRNDNSSRSHAICRIRFENPQLPNAKDGLLYLIDLAGSEAARDKVAHDSSRMKEAREINSSLSILKDCIRGRALADADSFAGRTSKKPAYVPFRQSTLTKTLKHIFDPTSTRSCKTVVVACVNPCLADLGASKNTMRYAEMLRVPMPKAQPLEYTPAMPATWNNDQLRNWIQHNSGTPPINALILAPSENGPQLLRLPVPEFVTRCLKTAGVSVDQARAFNTKLWKLHIDSQRNAAKSAGMAAAAAPSRLELLDSSVDPEPDARHIPFKERIRPGMVVRWNPPPEYESFRVYGIGHAMIMCPVQAAGERARDVRGEPVSGMEGYLCAAVMPDVASGSFGVKLWRQVVVKVEEMQAEIALEWDDASRYYYMGV